MDRKTAYPWIVTPPPKGRYIEGEHILFERPLFVKARAQSNYGERRATHSSRYSLSAAQDEAIRAQYETGEWTHRSLAVEHGVSHGAIATALRRTA